MTSPSHTSNQCDGYTDLCDVEDLAFTCPRDRQTQTQMHRRSPEIQVLRQMRIETVRMQTLDSKKSISGNLAPDEVKLFIMRYQHLFA